MLIKTSQEISHISDNSAINSENYMESMNFVDSLFDCLNKLKQILPMKLVKFLPSFKGKYTCEKYSIFSTDKENNMKYFILESNLFLEDNNIIDSIKDIFGTECENVVIEGDKLYLTLI